MNHIEATLAQIQDKITELEKLKAGVAGLAGIVPNVPIIPIQSKTKRGPYRKKHETHSPAISVPRDSRTPAPAPSSDGRLNMEQMIEACLPDLLDEFTRTKMAEVVVQKFKLQGDVVGQVSYGLRKLANRGKLTAEGATSARVYRKI